MINLIKTKAANWLSRIFRDVINEPSLNSPERSLSAIQQVALRNQYRSMLHHGLQLPGLRDVGFSVYSESDEDGILHFIFSVLGTANKKFVDVGAAIGGSNTANLSINHGWTGLLIEGSREQAEAIESFFNNCPATRNFPPTIANEWITKNNINKILIENGMSGEIDLLSIDIDGIDYYIWDAIDCISPRVVVVEFQCIWGPDESKSVPYSDDFCGGFVGRYGVYSGASIAAFVKLARKKNYRLVGCQRFGYNAFFVRNDVGADLLPEIPAQDCFEHPFTDWAREEFLSEIQKKEWVNI